MICDAAEAYPGREAGWVETATLAWNAGANSRIALAGDVEFTFKVAPSLGIIAGFATEPLPVADPNRIQHGLHCWTSPEALHFVQVVEAGKPVGVATNFELTDEFRIQRLGQTVTYWIGSTQIRESAAPSTGRVRCSTILFGPGDRIL